MRSGEGPAPKEESVVIRLATLSDAETVQEISAAAYVPAYQPVIGALPRPAHENYVDRIERDEVWVLCSSDNPLGVAVFELTPSFLLVYSIAVLPRYQGQGYGKTLLQHADRRAIGAGLREIRLYTNKRMERNLALYRSCGFVEVGTRPHPTRLGEVLVDMTKLLSSRERKSSD